MDFLVEAKKIKKELVQIRRNIHMCPELDFDLYKTSDKVKEILDGEKIEYFETAKTGICAIIRGNGDKTIALRADMDALPMQEKNDVVYSSKVQNKMHACGHDVHTSILIGAAKLLNSIKEELNGNVVLLFEPAEETTGGAKLMIKEGVLDKVHVDAVFGLHVEPNIEAGKIGIKKDVVNAASNPFTITIKGRGGHGAYPHGAIDPIVATSNIIVAIQNIVSREIDATSPSVISIGTINGGTAQNIIPDSVTISGIIRTMTTENREYATKRLEEVVSGICIASRTDYEIDIEESYPCLYNDDNMAEILGKSASTIIGKENIVELRKPAMGVESFAYFSLERPSGFYFLGTRNEEKGIIHPLHNSKFDVDEDAIPIGVAIQCQTVMDFLNNK